MCPLPRLHHLIPYGPSIPHHKRNGSKQRVERQFLDKQYIRSSRRCEFERVGSVGIRISVEGGMEDCTEAGGSGRLLPKLGGKE